MKVGGRRSAVGGEASPSHEAFNYESRRSAVGGEASPSREAFNYEGRRSAVKPPFNYGVCPFPWCRRSRGVRPVVSDAVVVVVSPQTLPDP